MHTSKLFALVILIATSSACSDRAPTSVANEAPTTPTKPSLDADPDALRAKLNAGGIPAEYSAHFDENELVRISEHRQAVGATALAGEYTFKGARLINYRGAKLNDSKQLDLQFDMQGVLQSGQGPDVSDEEISVLRGRAQLLRSHALAQRATRTH
jgi:hypothetical protein